jgi:hypothetical protein
VRWDRAVFDLARLVALVFALAACRPPRYGPGAPSGLVILALIGWEVGSPLVHHVTDGGPGAGFAFVFLGPGHLTPPTWLTGVEALVAAAASSVAFARATPLRPEDDVARAWDAVGLRFLLVAVLSGVLVVFDLLIRVLVRGDS